MIRGSGGLSVGHQGFQPLLNIIDPDVFHAHIFEVGEDMIP